MGKDRSVLERLKRAIQRLLRRGEPDDPYALVGAPNKPRPPVRSAAASVRPEVDS